MLFYQFFPVFHNVENIYVSVTVQIRGPELLLREGVGTVDIPVDQHKIGNIESCITVQIAVLVASALVDRLELPAGTCAGRDADL